MHLPPPAPLGPVSVTDPPMMHEATGRREDNVGSSSIAVTTSDPPSPLTTTMAGTNMSLLDRAWVFILVLLNVASVVGIVAVNKHIYSLPFTLPSTLMAFHFLTNWIIASTIQRYYYYDQGGPSSTQQQQQQPQQPKSIPYRHYALLGFTQAASVVLMNFSLVKNTVGSYQIFKYISVPMMCGVEYVLNGTLYSLRFYASLFVLIVGVATATVTDVQFSIPGVMFGVSGAIANAAYLVLNKKLQTDFNIQSIALMHHEQPWSAFFCLCFAAIGDDFTSMKHFTLWSSPVLWSLLLLSAAIAFVVKSSGYSIIGKTSPVTYGVIGISKTVGVLFLGLVVLGEPYTGMQVLGLLLSLLGAAWYSVINVSGASTGTSTATAARPT